MWQTCNKGPAAYSLHPLGLARAWSQRDTSVDAVVVDAEIAAARYEARVDLPVRVE